MKTGSAMFLPPYEGGSKRGVEILSQSIQPPPNPLLHKEGGFARCSLILLMFFVLPVFAIAESTETFTNRILALNQQIASTTKDLQQEKKNNANLVWRAQESKDALKAAYASAERLNALNGQLNKLREQHAILCKDWRVMYAQTVDDLLIKAQNEKDPKQKGVLGKTLQDLQKQNIRLCADNMRINVSQEWRSIRTEPYDGPQEINQKIQLLQEISREININLAQLERQLHDFQKERKTKERAEEFIQESTLFTDNVAVRRSDGGLSTLSTPGDRESSSVGENIFTSEELYGKEQQEQFELQYQQKKKELLTQQKDLKQKLQEMKSRAQQLEIP
jgi:DNA repair exonuclease SbcCD ATPase subunit